MLTGLEADFALTNDDGRICRERLGGIGDEAGPDIDTQVGALRGLGFGAIELRSVDGRVVCDLDERTWDKVEYTVAGAGLRVSVLASRIGSWARPIGSSFASEIAELQALLSAASRLDCPYIRIMSYPNDGRDSQPWQEETVRRISILAELAEDAGVTLLHENCHGWAASNPQHAMALLEVTRGRGFAFLYDVGNPIAHGYDALAYLEPLLPYIKHCHVKDVRPAVNGGNPKFTMPGEGTAPIMEALARLFAQGYAGGVSIEPHLDLIPHLDTDTGGGNVASFIAWGQRFTELLDDRFGLR